MIKKIKILIITHTFPTEYNPVAAIFLLNQLVELKKYCNIKVIFPYAYVPKIKLLNPYYRFSTIPNKENIKGIEVYHPKYLMIPRMFFKLRLLNFYLSIESFFSYIASKKIAEGIASRWKPDIVHMHGQIGESLLGVHLKRKYSKPLVVTLYGEDVNRFAKQFPSNYLSKFALKNSDVIICQSEYLKKELNNIGVKNNRFSIIPMGALLSKFRPRDKKNARKILNLPIKKKIILFVGHLFARKGVEYLIKSIKIAIRKDKDVLCCIIGSGHSEQSLKELTGDLNLSGHIIFLGQKNHDEIPLYMNACDLFVLPSLSEGLPVVLCEALACGKPVVATKVAGTPELINKDVGYLVEPKNVEDLAKKILLALNKRWNKEKILQKAKNFSVKASARKLVSVYKSVIVK